MAEKMNIDRRKFLKGMLAGTTAGVLSIESCLAGDQTAENKILNYQSEMPYRRVGQTDVYLSVISFGGLVSEEAVYHYGIDRGVNLMHMSKSYKGGRSLEVLSKVMKSKRDKVYIAFKDNFDDIDEILKKLNTDHIDFLMFNRHSPDEVIDEENLERFEKYKKQGKVRYMGLTSHKNVKECVRAGIDAGYYSLIMPVLNQPAFEAMSEELADAEKKNVGIMAMKSMKGIDGAELEHAHLKKILANKAVTTVNKGIGSFDMLDAYMKSANEVLTSYQDSLLYHYAQQNKTLNCMMCGECEKACPEQVEISTQLRCYDYYENQLQDRYTAVTSMQAIPVLQRSENVCRSCKTCEQVCPNGIKIIEKLKASNYLFHLT